VKRSTRSLGAVALAAFAAIACTRSKVVEAPMIDANASASALALVRSPVPATQAKDARELPFKPGDRWTGTYTCRQGPTEMAITFDEIGGAGGDDGSTSTIHVEATFAFHFDGSSTYPASDGAARMRGTYDPKAKRLRLVGHEWIEQPQGYALINLVGLVTARGSGDNALSYAGAVEGPGCTSFSAHPEGFLELLDEKSGPSPPRSRSLPRARP